MGSRDLFCLHPPPPPPVFLRPQLQIICYIAHYYVKNSTCAWGYKGKTTKWGGGGGGKTE